MRNVVARPVGRWTLILAATVLVLLSARAGRLVHTRSQPTSLSATRLVLVGRIDHPALTATDRSTLAARPDAAQLGAVSVRGWSRSDCATAGWATIGAGSSVVVDGPCSLPEVANGRVVGWPALQAAQVVHSSEARLGTLADSVPGCISAVGPGAAVAAAQPDGTVERVQTLADFVQGGGATSCALTIVDAGTDSDPVVRLLAGQPDLTIIVAGVAAAPGSPGPGLQAIYRRSARPSGWLTSASTRRPGLVTLADLTPTLVDFAGGSGASAGRVGLRVHPTQLSPAKAETRLDGVADRSRSVGAAEVIVAAIAAVAAGAALLGWWRRRPAARSWATAALLLVPLTMTLAGLGPWWRLASPVLALLLLVVTAALGWGAAAFARAQRLPLAVIAAGATTAVLALDAVSGGLLQEGSLLNPQGLDGGRWYGFGNLTFAVYACSGLVLTGYLAHHGRATGRPRLGTATAAVAGGVLLLSDGWPSMGDDFGGVLALTPPMIGLLLVLGGRTLSWRKVVLAGGGALLVAALVALLDWSRGPTRRTHIGDFVQRLLDADAGGLVARKAAAAAQTVATPWGLTALGLGGALWVLVHTRLLRPVPAHFPTIVPVAWAALATAVLGTALNDSGVLVWAAITATFTVSALALHLDDRVRDREPAST